MHKTIITSQPDHIHHASEKYQLLAYLYYKESPHHSLDMR